MRTVSDVTNALKPAAVSAPISPGSFIGRDIRFDQYDAKPYKER